MKLGFYPRLALDGIRKNRRLYVPYLLTCVGMMMMFYIVYDLQESPAVAAMRGGEMLQTILGLGAWVIGAVTRMYPGVAAQVAEEMRREGEEAQSR